MEICEQCEKQVELYELECCHRFCFACLQMVYKAGVFFCPECSSESRNFPRVAALLKTKNYVEQEHQHGQVAPATRPLFKRPITPTPAENKLSTLSEEALHREKHLDSAESRDSVMPDTIIISLRYQHPVAEQQSDNRFSVEIGPEHKRKADFLNLVLECTQRHCRANITILIGNSHTSAEPFTHLFSHTFAKQLLSIPVGPTEYLIATFGETFDISVEFDLCASDDLKVQDLRPPSKKDQIEPRDNAEDGRDQPNAGEPVLPQDLKNERPLLPVNKAVPAIYSSEPQLPKEKETSAQKVLNYIDELPDFVLDVTNPKGFKDVIQLYSAQAAGHCPVKEETDVKANSDANDCMRKEVKEEAATIAGLRLFVKQLRERIIDAEEETRLASHYQEVILEQRQQIDKYQETLRHVIEAAAPPPFHSAHLDGNYRIEEPLADELQIRPRFFNTERELGPLTLHLADFRYFTVFRAPSRTSFEGGRFDAIVVARSTVIRELFTETALGGSIEGVYRSE